MSDNFLLFDVEDREGITHKVLPLFEEDILPKAWTADDPAQFNPDSRVYAYVSDQHVPAIMEAAIAGGWQLAILPHPNASYARRGFCLEGNLEKAVKAAQQAKPRKVDILRCNSEIVLSSVVLGHGFSLRPGGQSNVWQERLEKALHNIRHVNDFLPKRLTFTTANDSSFSTAAVGVVVVEHAHGSMLSRNILTDSHPNDGMHHAMILAPRSVMEILSFFIKASFNRVMKQPDFLGLVKTKTLTITNNHTLEYEIDSRKVSADELVIDTEPRCLSLLVGDSLPIVDCAQSSKEQRKVARLPAGEAINAMAAKPLSWIAHAAPEEFKDLYQLLRENATASPAFLTLMVLSTLLASIGLYASSAPVIIGAMILAPLMAPIISLSMALTRQDPNLMMASSKTLTTGLCMALLFSATASFIMPMEVITNEIAARLSPNLLDLGVAAISGIAGAYAHARIDAAKSLAGVAIAVALVPPLAVTGIGLGWLDWHVAWGAFLLFLTNLAGIVFAASLTFLALGFAPFTRAKKGLSVALIAVALVSIPLVFSFMRLSDEANIVRDLEGEQIGSVILRHVQARAVEPVELSLQIVTPAALTGADLDTIKDVVEGKLKRDVIMEAQVVIRRE
ncbi:TIGR00341 family protein [Motilimonas eburnea]|uniref:TIGR00341 family protein n=1 Tax=Motilimonas eburnea TaxID=1737488 RepID=UPI001E32B8D4|nr:TIGR00341 family protein [Motilimonas eburnea]MCE2573030.1 TIGR00341 family protein [Motilimonas eburnea]